MEVTGFLEFPNPNLTQSLRSVPGPAHPLWAPRSGGSAHIGPLHSPTHRKKRTQTFPGRSPLVPDEDQRGRDQHSLSGPQPLTTGAGECRRARPCPSQAASARPSLASAPRPAPGSAPPWGAGLRAPARTASLGSAALGRAGTGGRCGAAEERGDSAATAPPPPRIAGFVLALSLCPPSCSHNAVGFACLNLCGPQSESSFIPGDYRCGCPALLHPEGPGPADSSSLQKTMSHTASLAVLLKTRNSKTWKNEQVWGGKVGYSRIFLMSPSWS